MRVFERMKCSNCAKKGKIKHIDKMLCPNCFCKIVERKVKQEFKRYNIKKGAKLQIMDDATEFFLSEVIKLPLKIGKIGRKILAWTIDDEIEEFLTAMFEGNKLSKNKNIKLFRLLSKKDIEEYMKIKGIKYKMERSEMNLKVDKLNDKYPQTKNSMLKSIEELR